MRCLNYSSVHKASHEGNWAFKPSQTLKMCHFGSFKFWTIKNFECFFFPDTFCSKLESSTCLFARKIHLLKDTVWLVRLKMCTTYSSSPTRSSPNSMLIFFHLGDDSNVFPPLVPFFFCTVLLAFVLIAALKNQNNKVAFTCMVLNELDFTWHSQD